MRGENKMSKENKEVNDNKLGGVTGGTEECFDFLVTGEETPCFWCPKCDNHSMMVVSKGADWAELRCPVCLETIKIDPSVPIHTVPAKRI